MNDLLHSADKQLIRYKNLAEKAIEQLDEKQFFWRPNDESNSVAVLVKHISGNMRLRFTDLLTTDGEKTWRNRDGEFVTDGQTKQELMKDWQKSWDCLFEAMSGLTNADLEKQIFIRGEKHSVTNSILAAIAHYSDHIGQIIYIAKMQKGGEWKTLSIPKKKVEHN